MLIFRRFFNSANRLYIGKMDNLEVDFVAIDENNITYYQVAATVRDETTLKRELASLQQINDQYPKYILTLDEDPTADYNGIKRINALRWLMGEIG
ncbi:ATP-binding protein [Prevotella copri]|nr:ATP-binding protein [Segatella copri]